MVKVSRLKEGQLVEGTITHLTKFGAFAKLDEDMEGLIHISELSDQRINHPKEVVKEGDVVTLRVIKVDAERRRKRRDLLDATDKGLTKISKEVARRKKKLLTESEIAFKGGKALGRVLTRYIRSATFW